MIALPGYIDPDAWQGFEDMRKTIRKPLTDRSRKLIVYELDRIKTAGHCPNAALDQSTCHCWADVYQPREKPIEAAATSLADKTAAYLAEQERHRIAAAKDRLRRVA